MIDAIRAFAQKHMTAPPADAPDAARRYPIALAAAALLLELAHADGEFTSDERARIDGALAYHFGLDTATGAELLALAEQARTAAVDHFQFTKVIAESYDVGQRMLLAELMWGVVLADGELSHHEAYLVRKFANLLNLEPAYLAQARQKAADRT